MLEATDTYRLALAVFHDPQDLRSAIAELCIDGFTVREFCLAGKRSLLDEVLKDTASSGGRRLQSLQMPGGDEEFVATSGPTLKMLLEQSKSRSGNSAAPASFWPDLCRGMADHMRRDGIVLCVSAQDAALQSRSSRILLRHSTQSVQTFEFTPAR
jgi:hypothetical protein